MKRLESLDILRGIDLFALTIFGPLMLLFAKTGDYSWEAAVIPQFHHAAWEGFRVWDLIMPLFMFMSGVTIPYSMEKFKGRKKDAYFRILRRFVVLWVLGMVAQGHLLDLNWQTLRFFSNTLQAIAVGYLFSAIFYLELKPRWQIVAAAALLLAFWALMTFCGGGNYAEHGNLCEIVDNAVLGAHRDQASIAADGSLFVNPEYGYTWIISSLTFIVTVMTGMFAGEILKDDKRGEKRKMLLLLAAGAGMLAAGWLWSLLGMPVIKKIWTSSMTLVASGYCFLLLLAIYYLVDYRKKCRWLGFFKIWGMNSILAYMVYQVLRGPLAALSEVFLHGFALYLPDGWYKFVIGIGSALIQGLLLRFCYRRKIYLKV